MRERELTQRLGTVRDGSVDGTLTGSRLTVAAGVWFVQEPQILNSKPMLLDAVLAIIQ